MPDRSEFRLRAEFRLAGGSQLRSRMATSILLGVGIAAVGIAVEAAIGNHPIFSLDSFDNIATGAVAGLVVFIYEQGRYKNALEHLHIIAEMNHHVRNALQAIVACREMAGTEQQILVISQAVNRIEWALREVLPGKAKLTVKL
jgi:hypothetical protein